MLQKMRKTFTVNTGQVMFSGEIYYYWPLNSSEKSGNIPIAERWIVCFSEKYVGFNRYFDFWQLLYVFEEIF